MVSSVTSFLNWITSPNVAGCAVSLSVHAMGAILAWSTLADDVWIDRARLPGKQPKVELTATWSPAAEQVEEQESEPIPPIVIKPDTAQIADQTFKRTSTNVSEPVEAELRDMEPVSVSPPKLMQSQTHQDKTEESQQETNAETAEKVRRPDLTTAMPSVESIGLVSVASKESVGSDVTTMPQLLHNPPPVYPASAVVKRLEGTALLRVHIDETGKVSNVDLVTTSGYRVLDAAAVRAVRQWKFVPAKRGDMPIKTTVRLPVRFELD